MLIDWFTVAAQLANFLILVWLLKRFLYKPILRAIDAREQQIALALADADAKMTEAEKERDEFLQKNELFDRQCAALLSQATDEAKAESQRLMDEARQESDALRVERREALRREQQSLNTEIVRRTRKEVFAIARKALTDLAGTSLEARIGEVFVRRLQALGDEAKQSLANALTASAGPAIVRSAFKLTAEQRAMIQTALNTTLPTGPSTPSRTGINLRFETEPDLISGIELSANGRKIVWSIADYLVLLEKSVGELLAEPSNPQAKPEDKSKSETHPDVREEAG